MLTFFVTVLDLEAFAEGFFFSLVLIFSIKIIYLSLSSERFTIIKGNKSNLLVGTADGAIQIIEIQLEGKRKMTAKEFIIANELYDDELLS